MVKVIETKVFYDEENDAKVFMVRFDGPPSQEDFRKVAALCSFPWGQALPSNEPGWFDVGNE